jgi:hypothetical protein
VIATRPSKSAKVRAQIGHPIIDSDGHTLELTPVFMDYVKDLGGGDMVARYKAALDEQAGWMSQSDPNSPKGYFAMTEAQRRDTWTTRPPWWASVIAK